VFTGYGNIDLPIVFEVFFYVEGSSFMLRLGWDTTGYDNDREIRLHEPSSRITFLQTVLDLEVRYYNESPWLPVLC